MDTPIKTNKEKPTKRIVIAITLVVGLLLFDICVGGLMKFGYNVVYCGGIPVAISSRAFNIGPTTYVLPGNYIPGWATTEYACTEAEAIERGAVKDLHDNQPIFTLKPLVGLLFWAIIGLVGVLWWRLRTNKRAKN